MEIIGSGFLARHLDAIAGRHPDTVALAAGVSSASGTSQADFDREADLVRRTAERCRAGGARLLFFSTASAGMYGLCRGRGREDRPVRPASPYGEHKLGLEAQLRQADVDHLIVRMTHLVGPGQPTHQLLPTLTRLIRHGRVRVHRDADRDLLGIGQAVRIIDLLLARAGRRETVNVASGTAVPVETIVDHLELRLGLAAERDYQAGGTRHAVSIAKLRRLVPQVASIGFGAGYYRSVLDEFLRWELSHA